MVGGAGGAGASAGKAALFAANPALGIGVETLGLASGLLNDSAPSTAVSGGNPRDGKSQQINITPTGVNIGELIQALTTTPSRAKSGFGFGEFSDTITEFTGGFPVIPLALLSLGGLLVFKVAKRI